MATTYTLIRKITVGSATAGSITFSNIPSTYTDLKLVSSAICSTDTEVGLYLSLNGLTTNFSSIYMYANVNPATSGSLARYLGSISGNTYPNYMSITFPNYSSTSYQKQYFVENTTESNSTAFNINRVSGLWASTAAITSITISNAASFGNQSTFYLYGISSTAAITLQSPKAYGGDSVTYDGTYWYHTFLTSGTFTPKASLSSVDMVYIAGGGGGGSYRGGGGGAGGMAYQNNLRTLANTSYPVLVGGGGPGGAGGKGINGTNSTALGQTATGGGGGGSAISGATANGNAGGSGGGGVSASWAGGTGISGQGFAGGTGDASYSGKYGAGGGGGAGAVGGNGSSATGGSGGSGNSSSVFAAGTGTGVSNYYAGGGAGGGIFSSPTVSSSAGGGGNSPINSNGGAGTTNTGSGGGGANSTNDGTQNTGGAGASGIVIIRYAS